MILDLHRQGLSLSAIARQTGLDRKTIRRYIERGLEPPAYMYWRGCVSKIAAFEAYLRERVEARHGRAEPRTFRASLRGPSASA